MKSSESAIFDPAARDDRVAPVTVPTGGVPSLASFSCPVPVGTPQHITLAHGSGGKLTHQLIASIIAPAFSNPLLDSLHDGAVLTVGDTRLAFTTDSFVVNPPFFPGGDIGVLAVNGTVNDLAMCGATPLYLSVGFVLEEGFALADFRRVVESMRAAASAAGVLLVTGDTKVVDRGKGDKIFISTSGIGTVRPGAAVDPRRARPGDCVLVSGPIAVHGIAIMSVREGLAFESEIASDTAPLHGLVEAIFATGADVHVLRDPTRGGLSSTVVEIAEAAGVGIRLNERAIPVTEEVRGACEILGLDPLFVANEGKLVAIVPAADAGRVLAALQAHPAGAGAAIIGEVVAEHPGMVILQTQVGGERVVDMLPGEQLPRIC